MSGPHFGRQNPQGNHVKVPSRDRARAEEENTPGGRRQMFCHIRSGSPEWQR